MMLLELVFYFVLAVIAYNALIYLRHIWYLKSYPPGPFPLPVIGNLHLLDKKKPDQTFVKLGKIYGDVFSISFGMERIVIVNKIEPAREAVVTKAGDFSGRPVNIYIWNTFSKSGADIVFSDYGSELHGRRMLASKALRAFSDNGNSLEETITKMVERSSQRLEKYSTTPVNIEDEIKLTIYSIMSHIVFGLDCKGFEEEGFNVFKKSMEYLGESVRNDPTPVFPWLKHFPILTARLMKKCCKTLGDFISKEHLKHIQKNSNNPTSFLSWIVKTSKDEQILKQYKLKNLTRDNIETLSSEMVLASCDTTSAILLWGFLHLLHQPKLVDEIFKEIQSVVGPGKYPALKDRTSLPKVQAFIQECLRIGVSPVTIPHKATRDSSIGGHPIKKETPIMFNVWMIHHDERHWENPLEFNPYRWIDEDRKFNAGKHKSYLPFFTGKRSCIGEQIARTQLFLIFTRIIVDFKIERDPNSILPKLSEGVLAFTLMPLPFKVLFAKR